MVWSGCCGGISCKMYFGVDLVWMGDGAVGRMTMGLEGGVTAGFDLTVFRGDI